MSKFRNKTNIEPRFPINNTIIPDKCKAQYNISFKVDCGENKSVDAETVNDI